MEAVRFEVLDVERWALGVEKEPRRLLSPEYKFIGRPEEAPASGGLRAGPALPMSSVHAAASALREESLLASQRRSEITPLKRARQFHGPAK